VEKVVLACVASVSVGFSARSRHFSLFDGAKIGLSATLIEGVERGKGGEKRKRLSSLSIPLLTLFCARPNFCAFKGGKML